MMSTPKTNPTALVRSGDRVWDRMVKQIRRFVLSR